MKLLFVCLAAHVVEFHGWTPGFVKLLLPPRHSRGVSRCTRPAPGVPERRLAPIYYLHNFRRALATLAERYAGLLDADEGGFIEQFDRQAEPVQCLLARLVMRKGPLFRRASLGYAEVLTAA